MIGPLLFAVIAIGFIASRKADASLDAAPPQPSPPPLPPPVSNAPPGAYALPANCAAAVQGLPEPLRSKVFEAITTSTNPAALRDLAKYLDSIAVMYTEPIASSARNAAQCARDRANAIGGGGAPIFPTTDVPGNGVPVSYSPGFSPFGGFTYKNINDAPAASPTLGAGSLPGGFG